MLGRVSNMYRGNRRCSTGKYRDFSGRNEWLENMSLGGSKRVVVVDVVMLHISPSSIMKESRRGSQGER